MELNSEGPVRPRSTAARPFWFGRFLFVKKKKKKKLGRNSVTRYDSGEIFGEILKLLLLLLLLKKKKKKKNQKEDDDDDEDNDDGDDALFMLLLLLLLLFCFQGEVWK